MKNVGSTHTGNQATYIVPKLHAVPTVVLSTILISVRDVNGKQTIARALLDTGSGATMISEKLMRRLSLVRRPCAVRVDTVGELKAQKVNGCVKLHLEGLLEKIDDPIVLDALILGRVVGTQPQAFIEVPPGFYDVHPVETFADPQWNSPDEVDILLGADVYHSIVTGKTYNAVGGLTLLSTICGLAVSGPLVNVFSRHVSICHAEINEINSTLEKFWSVEEVPDIRKAEKDSNSTFHERVVCKNAEEEFAEKHFAETSYTDSDGRIITSLPFIKDVKLLGDSSNMALVRFLNQEAKLQKNPISNLNYQLFLKEFADLGHTERVPESELIKPRHKVYYIPHLPVIKEDSTTTKIRVVFDASAPTTTGLSLNDTLACGPKLQDDLFHILCRFRFRTVGLIGDIAKMYRQIGLTPESRDYHRFYTRPSPDMPIEEWRMVRVVYGVKSASHVSIKSLQTVMDRCSCVNTRRAADDFYVDDWISGSASESEAEQLVTDLCAALKAGGFELRKFGSSTASLVNALPEKLRENPEAFEFGDLDHQIKTLGVNWFAMTDKFGFFVKHLDKNPESSKDVKRAERNKNRALANNTVPSETLDTGCTPVGLTKRQILSDISKIFDPLGLVSPSIVTLKICMQEIWKLVVGWDEVLPEAISKTYMDWRTSLVKLRELMIPRRVLKYADCSNLELHVFCDASSKAYGAVVYVRQVSGEDVSVGMLTSKCKVAPVKITTIPKLELCAVLTGVRLMQSVRHALRHTEFQPKAYLWTDSTTVLHWLANLAGRWGIFVGNRVQQIQDVIGREDCFHVPTDENPADLVSRGVTVEQLLDSKLWWLGPDFLQSTVIRFPVQPTDQDSPESAAEEKKVAVIISVGIVAKPKGTEDWAYTSGILSVVNIERFSDLDKLLKCIVMLLRYFKVRTKRHPKYAKNEYVTAAERQRALILAIISVQTDEFRDEIAILKKDKFVPSTNRLHSLYPFLDKDDGVLRVGGRLYARTGTLSQYTIYPAILAKKGRLTTLLAHNIHQKTMHGGLQLCIAESRRSVWVISIRQLFREIIRGCTTCFRFNSKPRHALMGDLPKERVTPSEPFTHTGLDFAGPLSSKGEKGIKKVYLAIFVCFSTKAMHIEVVSSLTTFDCIAAILRFVSRRGVPDRMYSDNGTNFTGARSELNRLRLLLDSKVGSVPKACSAQGMEWVFIPPGSPNFGGLWEAAVKSAKSKLKKVMGKQVLTYEELTTLCCDVEAILNSRPLVPMTDDPRDLDALTPFKLLTLRNSKTLPILGYNKLLSVGLLCENPYKRWQHIRNMTADFWRRWQTEYLTTLNQRKKDAVETPNLKVNDMVLLTDERLQPLQWPLGRIVDVFPGNDGQVRTVRVRTKTGVYNRAACKARLLPIPVGLESLTAAEC